MALLEWSVTHFHERRLKLLLNYFDGPATFEHLTNIPNDNKIDEVFGSPFVLLAHRHHVRTLAVEVDAVHIAAVRAEHGHTLSSRNLPEANCGLLSLLACGQKLIIGSKGHHNHLLSVSEEKTLLI